MELETNIKNDRYEMIIDELMDMILEGKIVKDSKLPSENQMSKKFGVSRAHVREVYRALCIFGIFESYQGEGTFYKKNNENMPHKLLSMMFFQASRNLEEIMEVRRIIEIGIAESAAINRTDKDVNDMLACIELMEKSKDSKEVSMYDAKLHYIIGRSCGNPMLVELSKVISGLVVHSTQEHWDYIMSDKNRSIKLKSFEQHRDLVESIMNKKPYIAKVVAQEHLEMVIKSIKKYSEKANSIK